MTTLFIANAKTLEPTLYSVWAIDRATKKEVEFQVQAFTIKEAMEIARTAYTEQNPDGLRIRVCVASEKFEQAKTEWAARLEATKEKNHAEKIDGLHKIFYNKKITDNEKFKKILEYVGYTK